MSQKWIVYFRFSDGEEMYFVDHHIAWNGEIVTRTSDRKQAKLFSYSDANKQANKLSDDWFIRRVI